MELAWCVSACKSLGTSVLSELEHSTLSIRSLRLDNNILWVLSRHDDPGGKLQLLPGLLQVDHVDAVTPSPVGVSLHLEVAVLRS